MLRVKGQRTLRIRM